MQFEVQPKVLSILCRGNHMWKEGKPAVLSVFGLIPLRIGGMESFARELSMQLGRHAGKCPVFRG